MHANSRSVVYLLALFAALLLLWLVFSGVSELSTPFFDDQAFPLALGRVVAEGNFPLNGLPAPDGGRDIGPLYPLLLGLIVAVTDGDVVLLATWITVGLSGSSFRESVPPHHSLVHAQEVAAVLRRHYDEAPLLLLRKDELPRKNAIYYFMAPDSFARMQHSARFDEFASYIAQGRKRRELVENGVFLSCGMDREGRTPPNRVPGING